MATAPNMNVASLVPQVGVPPAVEGEGADLFASLLPIVTEAPADGHPTTGGVQGQVTSDDGAIVGAPITPGVVPDQSVTIDFHAATPKSEDSETDGSDAADPDAASPLLPEADFLPTLQAQTNFPAIVVTALVVPSARGQATADAQVGAMTPEEAPETPAPSKLPAPVVQAQAPAARPAAPIQPFVAVVPQIPMADPSGPTIAPADSVTQNPVISVAVRQVVQSPKEQELGAGIELPAKRVAKGDLVQPVKALAEANSTGAAPAVAGTGTETATERSTLAEKTTAPSPAPLHTPIVPTPSAPASITPLAAAIDPAASLQPVRAEAGAPPPPPAGEAAITRELDLAHESEWLDRLARDIARTGANDGPMRFKLNPNTLGHLQVELAQGERGTSIRLTVETEAARNILADAQPRLLAEARAQGVRIAQSEIDLSGNGHPASGDPRRHQEDARQTVMIRTARAPDGEAAAAVAPARTRADRYA